MGQGIPWQAPIVAQTALTVDHLADILHRVGIAERRLCQLLNEQLIEHDLSDTEFFVLWLCERTGQQRDWSQGDLALAIGVSAAQMSTLMERLRQRGLLDIGRSTLDRRRQIWSLLPSGKALLALVRERSATSLGEWASVLSADRRQNLCEGLSSIAATPDVQLRHVPVYQDDTATPNSQRGVP